MCIVKISLCSILAPLFILGLAASVLAGTVSSHSSGVFTYDPQTAEEMNLYVGD